MKIKYDSLERVEGQKPDGKTWVAYKIVGNKLDGGGRWESGNIFDNQYNAKILEDARELEQGDKVNVTHKQNDKGYWTITGIVSLTEEEVEEAKKPFVKTAGAATTSGQSSSRGGSTKSSWNGRTGEQYDRSASLYLAFDMMKSSMSEDELAALTPMEVFATALTLSTHINDYIHEGKVVAVLTDDEDALTPPNV
jgi:hypothetical protein